jgi:hypothetical protein
MERMSFARTVIAAVVALSVALLPVAGGAAFKPASAATIDMSASMSDADPMDDCCPPATSPCADCGSMAVCALKCFSFTSGSVSPVVYPLNLALIMVPLESAAFRSQTHPPPFRPPRI